MAPRPSAFRAEIEVHGDTQAADAIAAMGKRAKNTTPLMERVVGMLSYQQRARMDEQPWLPLADDTVARKTSENESPEIFRDEARRIKGTPTREPDALYKAITSPGAAGQLRYVTRASATFGVKSAGNGPLFYARFVQNVKGKKRRILAISQSDALVLVRMCEAWLFSGWPQ